MARGKDFYWYLIETKKHKPNNINKWCEVFQDFESANGKFQKHPNIPQSQKHPNIPLRKQKTKYMSSTIAFSILNILSTSKSFFNKNNVDVHSCQMQLKNAIEIECEICNKNKTLVKFEQFNFIYNNL